MSTIKIKRSAVAGKVPVDSDLDLGELAINTYDGKLFLKKSVSGTNTIVDVTASSGSLSDSEILEAVKRVDGAGSGLDADLLDGANSSYYVDWTNTTNKPSPVITVSLTGDVTGSANTTLTELANGSISITTTIEANSVALGADTTGNYVASITNGSYITGGDGGSEGAALTLAVDADSAATASKVVARDASGNFAANTITASLTGNASTATTLETTRTLWGQNFNGSADVTGNLTSVGNITGTSGVALTASNATLALAATGSNIVTVSTNGIERLRINSQGTFANGNINTNGEIFLKDDKWLYFGDGFDFSIYHDGTNSYIREAGVGSLNVTIDGAEFNVLNGGGDGPSTGTMLKAINATGAVELYYGNVKRFETTSSGATVTGSVTANTFVGNLTGNANTATTLETTRTLWGQNFNGSGNVTGALTSVGNITGTAGITLTATSATLGLVATGENAITATTNSVERVRIAANGNVGIANSTPIYPLDVTGSIRSTSQLVSTVATGTAPLAITSTTRVSNLNVATAGTADTLTTTRTLWGQNFNGSGNVTGSLSSVVDIDASGIYRGSHSTSNKWIFHAVDVADSSSTGGIFYIASEDRLYFSNQNVDSAWFVDNTNYVGVRTNFAERMRVTSGGNVGIGTTTPASLLEVAGDVTVSDKIIHSGDTDTMIRFPAANEFSIETGGSERLRVQSQGRVGIGTSTPVTRLHVVDSDISEVRADGVNQGELRANVSSGTNQNVRLGSDTFGGGRHYLNGFGAYPLTIATNAVTRMSITANGDIGIGTTSPSSKLHVVGNTFLDGSYTEKVFTITDGATVTLDPNNGSIQTWTLGGNRTPGQANWASGQSITLMIDDGAAYSINWLTFLGVTWETDGGTAPTLSTLGFTVIVLWKVGTTIYGARVGNA